MLNENRIVNGVNTKDPEVWKELYRHFYGALCNYVMEIVMKRDVAEDIVQECFISIWHSTLYFSDFKALSVYLYRSVHNNALKHLRDKNVDDHRLTKWSMEQDEVEEIFFNQAVEEELIRRLRMLISQLPKQRKEILLLSMDGLSVKEVSERLHVTVNTVKTQKKRAYAFLKEQLRKVYILLLMLK